jgi:RND family efflux transporter MFP subunit
MSDNKNNVGTDNKTEEIKAVDNEIKETTGAAVEIYDEDDNVDLHDTPKKKKKLKKRWIVLGVVALLIIFFVVRGMTAAKNAVVIVDTMEASTGDIENILSISGTVESAETKTFFSDVSAPLNEINVKVGDKVSKGDMLYTYDTDSLELAKKTAELSIAQAKGSYNSLYSGTAAADRKYAQGMNAQQINNRLDAITAEIDSINHKITEKTTRVNQTMKDIQNTMQDVNQNGIGDNYEAYFDSGSNSYITRTEEEVEGDDKDPTSGNRQASLALQQTYNDVQYKLNNDPEIQAWKDQITTLQEEQSHLQSAKASLVNPGTAESTKAQYESTELSQTDNISKIEKALEGVKADFNGVVTAVSAVEGATVTTGAQILSMANLDDVQVSISVSKSDLPKISVGQKVDITINGKSYNGEVKQISGNATKNNNGVAVVATIIKITDPDSDIILGVEASNKIHAEKAENTLVLPYEYVQTDSAGDYVYVFENNTVVRKDVTIGIASSTDAQILDGISAGDKIITSDVSMLTEGMVVVENPQS